MDGINLIGIEPLTEAEAGAYFSQPTAHERYAQAVVNLDIATRQIIERWVEILTARIDSAYRDGEEQASIRFRRWEA